MDKIQLVRVRSKDLTLPLKWPAEIKNEKLKYFLRGEGYRTTKAFDVLDETIPEKWSKLSWLDIAKYTDKFGLEVGEYLADGKTAGIVARQTASGYYQSYKKIKDIIPDDLDPNFFNALVGDYTLACFGLYVFDITAMDKILDRNDPDYDSVNCTYKDQTEVSLNDYVQLKWGDEYVAIVEKLLTE